MARSSKQFHLIHRNESKFVFIHFDLVAANGTKRFTWIIIQNRQLNENCGQTPIQYIWSDKNMSWWQLVCVLFSVLIRRPRFSYEMGIAVRWSNGHYYIRRHFNGHSKNFDKIVFICLFLFFCSFHFNPKFYFAF